MDKRYRYMLNFSYYRNASNKCPGCLLNFCEFKGGRLFEGGFKRRGRLLNFVVYQAVPFPLISCWKPLLAQNIYLKFKI